MSFLHLSHKRFLGGIEHFFYRWGMLVSNHPLAVIGITFLITVLCSLGLLAFRVQYTADRLWIPSTSSYRENKEWKNENFKKNTRYENVAFRSANILTPHGIMQMLKLHKKMTKFKYNGATFDDLCLKLPVENLFYSGSRKSGPNQDVSEEVTFYQDDKHTVIETDDTAYYDEYDIWDEYPQYAELDTENITLDSNYTKSSQNYKVNSADNISTDLSDLPPNIYCDLVTTIDQACFELSLLEIWLYDEEVVSSLTEQEILNKINTLQTSPWFFSPRNYTEDLGGITRNSSGHVVSAEVAWVQIILEIPEDAELVAPGGIGLEFEVADQRSLEFEEYMVSVCNQANGRENVEIRPLSGRSFNDISYEAVFFDAYKIIIGYIIMFIYTVFMLGRINWIEIRLYLSGMGIFSCLMGLASAMGLTFLLGLEYNQTHNVLPFIAIGIGIDDMFVITECWYNINSDSSTASLSLAERMGRTMKHAGVSVTVTSITDVLAFALGAFTIMPGLRSFCVSAAICIAMIFLLQVSWFVAWLSLDQRRIESHRHGIMLCRTVEPAREVSDDKTEISYGKRVMKLYGNQLDKVWFKISVIASTLGLLIFGLYGSLNMIQRFDPHKMLPSDSYLSSWMNIQMTYFPSYGFSAWVMTGPLDWTDMARLDQMVTQLEQASQPGPSRILRSVDSWWPPFKQFLSEKKNISWTDMIEEEEFQTFLGDFLFDVDNAKQQANFRFSSTLQCGEPAPPILATQQQLFYGMSSSLPPPSEYLPAKQKIDTIVATANLSSTAFVQSPIYQAWETDAIISFELWRNLGMALFAVGLVSLAMLGNLRLCSMVMTCVMLTLVDLVGTLHFWDVTIDVVSFVNIVLATGLCVDYSVHIAHAFSISKGSRIARTQSALTFLGPAVFNGGVTTFLAVIVLPFSRSHIFVTFFKVFGLTVLYGLFHGLVLLPVLLASLGPEEEEKKEKEDAKHSEDNSGHIKDDNTISSGIVNVTFVPQDKNYT